MDIAATKNLSVDKSAKWHWLSPGFPDFEKKPVTANLSVSSLLRDLDGQLPANTALTVLVPEQISGLDGERIRLSRKVEWKIIPGKQKPTGVIPAQAGIQKTNTSNPESLDPRLRGDDETNKKNIDTIYLAIRYDEKHADAAIYFRATHAAWQAEQKAGEKEALDNADISSPIKPDITALVWLSNGELPTGIREWAMKGGTLIVSKDSVVPEIKSGVAAWRNEQGKVLMLVAPLGQGRILQWQQDLKPATMPELLDAGFPEQLKSLLQTKPFAPTQAFANSQTPLTGTKAGAETPQSLQSWFALLLALLFLFERWVANSARRWSAT